MGRKLPFAPSQGWIPPLLSEPTILSAVLSHEARPVVCSTPAHDLLRGAEPRSTACAVYDIRTQSFAVLSYEARPVAGSTPAHKPLRGAQPRSTACAVHGTRTQSLAQCWTTKHGLWFMRPPHTTRCAVLGHEARSLAPCSALRCWNSCTAWKAPATRETSHAGVGGCPKGLKSGGAGGASTTGGSDRRATTQALSGGRGGWPTQEMGATTGSPCKNCSV